MAFMSIAEVKRKVIADIEFDVGQGLVYRRRTGDRWSPLQKRFEVPCRGEHCSPAKKKSADNGTFQNYYC